MSLITRSFLIVNRLRLTCFFFSRHINTEELPVITAYQRDIRRPLPVHRSAEQNAMSRAAENELELILYGLRKSSLFIFPEYFAFHSSLVTFEDFLRESEAAERWVQKLSELPQAHKTVIVGGSVIKKVQNRYYNISPVYYEGSLIGSYKKRRLFGHEPRLLTPGEDYLVVTHPAEKYRIGIMICADVFEPGIFRTYARADFIVVPTSSPYRENDNSDEQQKRDREIFQAGSAEAGAVVLKSCSVGHVGGRAINGGPAPKLQGRSLVATADSIRARAPGIHWQGLLQYNRSTDKSTVINFNNNET